MLKKIFIIFIFINVILTFDSNVREFKNSLLLINQDNVVLNTPDDEVSFFAIGDWGGLPVFPFRTIIEQSTSNLMTSLAKLYDSKFQLALGDNFYFDGVKNVNDKRFAETYENVFKSDYLKNTPWFVILGNHDHYGNATAQVDYMSKSKRWILPSLNYSIDVLTNNGNTHLLSILMLDTSLLCGNTPHDGDEFSEPKFKTLEEEFLAQDYFKSIEKELSQIGASDVPYVLVTGHFPVWSIAEHGPTQCLVDKLRPMLHKYKVSAYLSGHDHNLQHITDDYMNHTCSYIVSGASNFVSNSTVHVDNIPKDSLKFHWPVEKNIMFFEGGFLTVRANPNNMTVTFMQSNGVELYQHIIYPRF